MADFKYLTISNLSTSTIQRFFDKVRVDPKTDCWIWTASKDTRGYGQFHFNKKLQQAHRFTYAWLRHSIPMGLRKGIRQLDHFVCNNPSCCNPWHTKLVFAKENCIRASSLITHCKNGHLFPPRIHGSRQRVCKICASNGHKTYYAKNKDKANLRSHLWWLQNRDRINKERRETRSVCRSI